jgi:hypothetical protein
MTPSLWLFGAAHSRGFLYDLKADETSSQNVFIYASLPDPSIKQL